MRLQGKNIILTGASRGFGKYLAEVLWGEGANLLLVVREIVSSHYKFTDGIGGQSAVWAEIDLSYPTWTVEAALSDWHDYCFDGLVNNAAIQGPIGPAWENKWATWYETLTTNLIAPVILSRLVVPGMIKRGKGKIVNLSGGGATSARPNYSAYATAKTGLVRFSECLAAELKDKGIDVNCVAPGAMPTDMLPPGEQCKPNAMQIAAECIVWLLSDESNGITGKLIAAQWDDYKSLLEYAPSDAFTLRRTGLT